ncbi:MAG: hypothetical protein QOG67_1346 [Verrucomicrobiota bacterium]
MAPDGLAVPFGRNYWRFLSRWFGFLELFCFRKIWKKKLARTSPNSKKKAIIIMVEVEMKTSGAESQMRS